MTAPDLYAEMREELAAHFRRRMNGVWSDEWEEQHRRKGLDPMRCNDSICLRAVEDADALVPLIAGWLAAAKGEAPVRDDGLCACGSLSLTTTFSERHDRGLHGPGRCIGGLPWLRAEASGQEAERADLTERGRRLASQREDLIASGVDPAELEAPLYPSGREGDS